MEDRHHQELIGGSRQGHSGEVLGRSLSVPSNAPTGVNSSISRGKSILDAGT